MSSVEPRIPTSEEVARYRLNPMAFAEDLIQPTPTGDRRFGDIMADFQRERFAVLAKDLVALQEKQPPVVQQHWWEATKGCSKDTDLAVGVIWLVTFSRRPLRIVIGAADQDQAAELRLCATAILNANPWLGERVVTEKWVISNPSTEAAAEIVAADVTGSHGGRPDLLILNELHAIPRGKKEFAENQMDNAAKIPWGIRIIATNAGFKNTWQWTWRENARLHPENWYFHKYDRPAPWITEKDLAEAAGRNSRSRYLRLWHGIWASATGDALDQADIDAAITMEGPHLVAQPGWVYGGALDLGVKRDHSAFVVTGTQMGSGRVAVVRVRSWRPDPGTGKVDLIAVKKAVRDDAETFGLVYVGYDPHQAELMAQELRAEGVPMEEMTFMGSNLNAMASNLMQAFRGRAIDLYRDPELLDDLQRLTIVERKWGYKLESASDESGHADRAIALSIELPIMMELANVEPPPADEELPNVVVT